MAEFVSDRVHISVFPYRDSRFLTQIAIDRRSLLRSLTKQIHNTVPQSYLPRRYYSGLTFHFERFTGLPSPIYLRPQRTTTTFLATLHPEQSILCPCLCPSYTSSSFSSCSHQPIHTPLHHRDRGYSHEVPNLQPLTQNGG